MKKDRKKDLIRELEASVAHHNLEMKVIRDLMAQENYQAAYQKAIKMNSWSSQVAEVRKQLGQKFLEHGDYEKAWKLLPAKKAYFMEQAANLYEQGKHDKIIELAGFVNQKS